MELKIAESHIIKSTNIETRALYAWQNVMPVSPKTLTVVGEIKVANPGIHANLYRAESDGINPTILTLDLYLHQEAGSWIQVEVWKPIRFKMVAHDDYQTVELRTGSGNPFATVDVEHIH